MHARYDVPQVEFMYLIFICMPGMMYHRWSLCTLYFLHTSYDVRQVEFMYLVFSCMPGESYRRQHRSLLLYLCYVF